MIDLRLLIWRSQNLHDRRPPYSAPLTQLDRENPGRSPNRNRCPPSPSQRPQTLRSEPSETSTLGPTFLDVAVARLARLALGSCPRETGNSRCLASQRFPILLDLEKPARASRETFDSQGRPRADPQHEQSQSALGSSAGSWRNPQTRNRALAGDRRQVHAPVSKATFANLAHVSRKSQQRTVSIDFFTVPTITFHVLYVFLALAHDRRRVIHFNVTAHPTAEWVSQQLVQAFPWHTAPRYLVRDRDAIYGEPVRQQLKDMAVKEILTAPRCPW